MSRLNHGALTRRLPAGLVAVAFTDHVRRITFNEQGQPIQREPILAELHQRIRDVRQGPDGYLYVLTDEEPGAVLRVEPAQ